MIKYKNKYNVVDSEALDRLKSMSISDTSSEDEMLLFIKTVHFTKPGCLKALKNLPEWVSPEHRFIRAMIRVMPRLFFFLCVVLIVTLATADLENYILPTGWFSETEFFNVLRFFSATGIVIFLFCFGFGICFLIFFSIFFGAKFSENQEKKYENYYIRTFKSDLAHLDRELFKTFMLCFFYLKHEVDMDAHVQYLSDRKGVRDLSSAFPGLERSEIWEFAKNNKFEFWKVVDREKPGCIEAISRLDMDFKLETRFLVTVGTVSSGAFFLISLILAIYFFRFYEQLAVGIIGFCAISFLMLAYQIFFRKRRAVEKKAENYRNALRDCLSHLTDHEVEMFDMTTDDRLNPKKNGYLTGLPTDFLAYLKMTFNQTEGDFEIK